MWDWAHFKDEGWLTHTKRSVRLAALLLASGTSDDPSHSGSLLAAAKSVAA